MRFLMITTACLVSSCAAHRFGVGVEVVQVTTPHFEVVGDIPATRFEREAVRLEQLFDVFAVFFKAEPRQGQRIRVAVMREGEPDEFAEGAGGFVTTDALEPLVITSIGEDDRFFVANTHELVHLLSSYALPVQPRWFAEGIAGLFEDAFFQRDGAIKMGTWREVSAWTTLDELLSWDTRSVPMSESGPLYDTSRAVLFYLANRDEERLQRLLEGMRARRPTAELYAELFPSDERVAFLERVKAFLAERKYSAWKTELRRSAEVSVGPPLAAWEISLLRSQLFRTTGRRDASRVAFEDSKALAPSPHPGKLLAERIERGEWSDGGDAPPALVQVALSGADDRSYAERLAAARDAATRLPLSALAALRLARAARAARLFDEALVAARQASSLAPWATSAIFEESRALAALKRCSEARAAFSLGVGMIESPEPSWVTKQQREVLKACGETQ